MKKVLKMDPAVLKSSSSRHEADHSKMIVLCIICAIGGGFIFGYSMGFSGVTNTQKSFIEDFCVDTYGTEDECFTKSSSKPEHFIFFSTQFSAMLSLGCIFGAIGGAVLNDYVGRRNALVFSTFIFSVASVFSAFAPSSTLVLLGRFLCGLGVGGSSTVAPVLISEVSTSQLRGQLSCVLPLMICIGLIAAALVAEVFEDSPVAWRICLGVPALPAVLVAAVVAFYPESPRWLMVTRGWEAAERSLISLRQSSEVQRELNGISDSLRENNASPGSWAAFCSMPMLKRIFVACMIQALLVGSGINMIFTYGNNILRDVGVFNRTTGLVIIYMINCIGTAAAIFQIDHVGRRALLLQGACGMFLGHLGSAITVVVLQLEDEDSLGTQEGEIGAYLFVSFVGVTTLYIASSFGPVAWIYPSEIFPYRARSKAVCVTTLVHWLTIYASSYSLEVIYRLGLASTFFLLAAMAILAFMFVVYFVPETKGHSLEEIQLLFTSEKGSLYDVCYEDQLTSLKAMYQATGKLTPNEEEVLPLIKSEQN